ncbi:MAG: hypothetical protein ACOC33_02190 [bacterium]
MKFSEYVDKNKYSIFVDMDGVLVDFVSGYLNSTGLTKQEMDYLDNNDSKLFWKPINDLGFEWWSNLNWMKDGKKLWNYVLPYNPTILSAPTTSNTKDCIIGKKIWIKKHLGDIPYIFERNKYIYADSTNILIDDTKEKIDSWVDNGGIGILHNSATETIEELKKL